MTRRFTVAKRDAAYDALRDALSDSRIVLGGFERSTLEAACRVLEDLTGRIGGTS